MMRAPAPDPRRAANLRSALLLAALALLFFGMVLLKQLWGGP